MNTTNYAKDIAKLQEEIEYHKNCMKAYIESSKLEADKRYKKVVGLFKQLYYVTEDEFVRQYPHIDKLFKIAAYGDTVQ